MAISGGDGSIILTTKVDESGMKKGTRNLRSEAMKLAATYRKTGLSQSEAQKKAYKELGITTKETERATKATENYGKQAKISGSTAKGAFLAVAKVLVTVVAAASAAVVAITKQAVDAYADYEQLVGGVETLFKGSAQKVIDYANDAFYTAGVSANEYMQQVTSFSASLISSLAGDTEKAADVANMALIDISDNANKMGSSLESVTLAYQGFAKGQYMLLDNLKLGYGGTKTEMERLLKDAEAYLATQGKTAKFSLDNLADVYTAINAIQQKLDIAGTTAKEAEKTITGSANMMKSAWQNVLSAIAGGGDLDRAINNLVYSIQKYFENIVPVIERALSGIGRLIEKIAPQLVQTVARSLIKAIPSLLNAVYKMILGVSNGIYQGIISLFNGTSKEALIEQANKIEQSVQNQKKLTGAIKETNQELKKSLAGFDDLQILSSGANGEESAGSNISSFVSPEIGESANLDALNGRLEKTNTLLEPIKASFLSLWETIKPNEADILASFEMLKTDVFEPFILYISADLIPEFVGSFEKAFDSIFAFFGLMEEPFQDIWEQTVKPIFDKVGEWILEIIIQTGDSFSYISEKFSEYEEEINTILSAIGLFFDITWSIVEPIISSVVEGIGNVLSTTIDAIFSIISIIGNAFGFIKNLFLAVISLFKGDIDGMGEYLKLAGANFINIFVGIANAIISVINNVWSLIFDSIKGTVNAIGGLIGELASLTGIDLDLRWDAKAPLIPMIPKYVPALARGAVLPANKPFLSIVGDQKNGTNIEAPAELIKQMAREAIIEAGQMGQTTKEEHYYLGETELMSILYKLVRGGERLRGESLISGGVY